MNDSFPLPTTGAPFPTETQKILHVPNSAFFYNTYCIYYSEKA